MLNRRRRGFFLLLCCLPLRPAIAQLRSIETDDLRLVFYNPQHTYLAPQLMRSFQNALDFHRRLFRYLRLGKVTVLLEDFGDYGHGGADVIPADRISLGHRAIQLRLRDHARQRAHELDHEPRTGSRGGDGRRGRQRTISFGACFGGKVSPNPEDPLSMAYGFLTTPRRYSPRWYHEGLATFLETWMSGGLGRALGGYDEMVFRTMVRDDSHIYDVVGLEAEGTTIDFQVGVNSYLYGTRFMTYLTAAVRTGEADGVGATHRWQPPVFRALSSAACTDNPLADEWSRWIGAERQWQNGNLTQIRQYPVTPLHRISDHALGSVSRAYYDAPDRETLSRLFVSTDRWRTLPRSIPHSGEISRLHDVEGPALFYVCALAFDPTGAQAVLHVGQQRLARTARTGSGNFPGHTADREFSRRRPGLQWPGQGSLGGTSQ